MVTFALLVYYLLPYALLSFNPSLFLGVFFLVILALLLGLVLLAVNLEVGVTVTVTSFCTFQRFCFSGRWTRRMHARNEWCVYANVACGRVAGSHYVFVLGKKVHAWVGSQKSHRTSSTKSVRT